MNRQQLAAGLVFNLPDPLLKIVNPKPAIVLRGNRLHVALQTLLEGIPDLPVDDDTDPNPIRAALAANPVDLGARGTGRVRRVDHQVAVGGGAEILVREYIPRGAEESESAMVYFHGGGWVLFSVETHDKAVAHMAQALGLRAYSVDYRLAPEHPFPKPLEDCAKAWDWAQKHTGLAAERLVVAGDSAGGNLSTALCLKLKAQGEPQPALQVLIYPATDSRMETDSCTIFGTKFYLTAAAMRWFWNCYSQKGKSAQDPLCSPAYAEDLSGLAPACVFTAGFDPLVDEGEAYAKQLEEAGVDVFYHCYPDMIHGFFQMGLISSCRRRVAHMMDEIRKRLPGK